MVSCKVRAWYMRENRRTAIPKYIIFLDTETKGEYLRNMEWHRMYLGWCWFVRLGKDLSIQRSVWQYVRTQQDIWDFVQSCTAKNRTLYIVGSNVVFDLFASGLAANFLENEWIGKSVHEKGTAEMIYLIKGKKRIKFVSVQNFLSGGVQEWGKLLGISKLECDLNNDSEEKVSKYCKRDVEITGKIFLYYLRFLKKHDLGGFSMTISSQSLRAFRHRFLNEKILHYDQDEITHLQRQSYYGGRCEMYQRGRFEGEEYVYVDFNSLYPSVMKGNQYPVRIQQYVRQPSLNYLESVLNESCVTAKVKLKTDEPVYPKRAPWNVYFPIGEFWTTLSTPEVCYAIDHNHLVDCHNLLVFEKTVIFNDYVDYFYKIKREAKSRKNAITTAMAKAFLNSLYGKFGERRDREIYQEYNGDPFFYRGSMVYPDSGEQGIEQQAFGKYTITKGKVEAPHSFPAIAAHVAAYGRLKLWRAMNQIGMENVLYCDTDGFIVAKSCLEGKKYLFDSEKLGMLDIRKETDCIEIRGAKDYTWGETRVTKGIREDAYQIDDNRFLQKMFPGLYGVFEREGLDAYPVCTITKTLQRSYEKGNVNNLGIVSPYVLSEE